jgi:hypothetical protein
LAEETEDKHLAERFKAMALDLFAKADDLAELLSDRDVVHRRRRLEPSGTTDGRSGN